VLIGTLAIFISPFITNTAAQIAVEIQKKRPRITCFLQEAAVFSRPISLATQSLLPIHGGLNPKVNLFKRSTITISLSSKMVMFYILLKERAGIISAQELIFRTGQARLPLTQPKERKNLAHVL